MIFALVVILQIPHAGLACFDSNGICLLELVVERKISIFDIGESTDELYSVSELLRCCLGFLRNAPSRSDVFGLDNERFDSINNQFESINDKNSLNDFV